MEAWVYDCGCRRGEGGVEDGEGDLGRALAGRWAVCVDAARWGELAASFGASRADVAVSQPDIVAGSVLIDPMSVLIFAADGPRSFFRTKCRTAGCVNFVCTLSTINRLTPIPSQRDLLPLLCSRAGNQSLSEPSSSLDRLGHLWPQARRSSTSFRSRHHSSHRPTTPIATQRHPQLRSFRLALSFRPIRTSPVPLSATY